MPRTLIAPAETEPFAASSPASGRSTPASRPEPEAVSFPDGIPGFEACRRFVLLASETFAPLQRIDAVEGPSASFLCIDPRLVVPGYQCALGPGDVKRLDVSDPSGLVWLSLVTVEVDGTVVANLRAPIVINPDRMLGRQVLPNDSSYPIRHVMVRPEP
jgi:flagellar assembly factor FliW